MTATPEVRITVDPNRALGAGLNAAQVQGEVRAALSPTVATQVTIEGETNQVDIVLRLERGDRGASRT